MTLILNRKKLLLDTARLGRWGQKQSEKFLKHKGLKLLGRNYAAKSGEIDLIMLTDRGIIVFVEVKTRSNEDFSDAESAVTKNKQFKIYNTARLFLRENNMEEKQCRFDVIAVILRQTGPAEIRHYENAFLM